MPGSPTGSHPGVHTASHSGGRHGRRIRTSTVALILLFVATLTTYLMVRPVPASIAGTSPAGPAAPQPKAPRPVLSKSWPAPTRVPDGPSTGSSTPAEPRPGITSDPMSPPAGDPSGAPPTVPLAPTRSAGGGSGTGSGSAPVAPSTPLPAPAPSPGG
jgi:hypothetical protein